MNVHLSLFKETNLNLTSFCLFFLPILVGVVFRWGPLSFLLSKCTFEMKLFNQQANGPYRRAFSEVVQDSMEGSPSAKDQNRNDAFIRFGQVG